MPVACREAETREVKSVLFPLPLCRRRSDRDIERLIHPLRYIEPERKTDVKSVVPLFESIVNILTRLQQFRGNYSFEESTWRAFCLYKCIK